MATVNLNVADVEELAEVEDVGPVLAERIIDYRTKTGDFSSVDELSEVTGIGDKLLARIKEKNQLLIDSQDAVEGGSKTVVGERDNLDLCPALQSCPFYEDKYCQDDYEECARYKIFTSALNSDQYLPAHLLPTDQEQADEILSENLNK